MRTKIAASLGIALALVFGILGVMAFFGSIPVQAHENAGIAEATDTDSLGNLVTDVKVEAVPNTLGSVAKWTVQFKNGTTDNIAHAHTDAENTAHINTDQDDNILSGGLSGDVIKVEFEDDVQFPGALSATNVTIMANMVSNYNPQAGDPGTVWVNPLTVAITKVSEFDGTTQQTSLPSDETLVTLKIPDMVDSHDHPGIQGIAPGATVMVVFRQTGGIKNPTESKEDVVNPAERAAAMDANGDFDASLLKPLSGFKVQVATSKNGFFVPAAPANRAVIPRRIVISDQDGPRGSTITMVGIGFQDSATVTIWNDQNRNGLRDSGETDLGSTLVTGSDDFTATITINNPPFDFDPATNGINAVDGLNRTIIPGRQYTGAVSGATFTEEILYYKLESSISVTPSPAGIGDTVRVTARDFVAGGDIANARISIGGVPVTEHDSTVVSNTGDAVFNVVIPAGVAQGTQNFVIKDGPNATSDPTHDIVNTGGARFNLVITGGELSVTPSMGLVPNQTVNLVGSDFSTGGGARINVTGSEATISGDDTDLGPRSEKFNEGNSIEVDNAGNWSSSFVIPITDVTTTSGNQELSITDTGGRSGSVNLNMAERRLTLTPQSGRVGTRVDIEGSGFPADNPAEGPDTTVTVEIQYSVTGDTRTVVTLTPDESGNVRGWFTVPLNAWIPSTNAVRAVFEVPASNVTITTSAVHQVPRASITLDKESGPAGTVVTINGEGFKRYTTVSEINFGTLDVRSGFGLSTDGEGAFETTFVVPVGNTGMQAVWVKVGDTTASATFTVRAAPVVPGAPTIITSPIIAGPNSLTVTWAAPGNTGGSVITAYDLRYVRTDADETVEANWTVLEDVWTGSGGLEYPLAGLAAGTQYDIQLRGVHVTGEGPWSATAVGTPATWGATRSYSRVHVSPGSAVVVSVTASRYGTSARVVETLPPGFTYVSGSLPETSVMVSSQEVSFTLLGTQAFTYMVTASSTEGPYSFSGFVINAEESEQPVAGISSITVRTAPSVYATSDTTTPVRFNSPISVTVAFSEPVLDFTIEDVDAANGVVSNFTGSSDNAFYTFDVTPNAAAPVTVDIAADAATGADGKGNASAPQLSLGIPYDDDHDGGISKDEAIAAVIDYFNGRITKEEAIAIIILYFSS